MYVAGNLRYTYLKGLKYSEIINKHTLLGCNDESHTITITLANNGPDYLSNERIFGSYNFFRNTLKCYSSKET